MPASSRSRTPETKEDRFNRFIHRAFTFYMATGIPEALNFCLIFGFHLSKAFLDFLFNTPVRFIVFPLSAIYGLTKAAAMWVRFYFLRKKKDTSKENLILSFIEALWETLNGLGTTGAVITGIIGFFLGISVGMGISITFNFFLAASTAVCFGLAVYRAYRAYETYQEWKKLPEEERTKDHPLYQEYLGYRTVAKINAIYMGIVAILTTGVIVAMVLGFPIGGIIGMFGCLLAAGYTAYNLYHHVKNPPSKEGQPPLKLTDLYIKKNTPPTFAPTPNFSKKAAVKNISKIHEEEKTRFKPFKSSFIKFAPKNNPIIIEKPLSALKKHFGQ